MKGVLEYKGISGVNIFFEVTTKIAVSQKVLGILLLANQVYLFTMRNNGCAVTLAVSLEIK